MKKDVEKLSFHFYPTAVAVAVFFLAIAWQTARNIMGRLPRESVEAKRQGW